MPDRAPSVFRLGAGLNFALFQYTATDPATAPPRNGDVAGHHLALCIDDFDAAIAYVRDAVV